MVDGQVRPNRVSDPRLLRAMRSLPRERFVPPHLAAFAYIDEDVPLGNGRVLMEPLVIARLVQMARVRPGDRALVVGAGAGYGAALLASCGAAVTALEEDESLLALGRAALPGLVPGVDLVQGPLAAGWDRGAPYGIVLIEGAVREIPPVIAAQVAAQGGRLVTVLRQAAGLGKAVLAEPVGAAGLLRAQAEFDCATPLLPPLRATPGFTF